MDIHCPLCNKPFSAEEETLMTSINTLLHKDCESRDFIHVIDFGSYEEIVDKYPFFKSIR